MLILTKAVTVGQFCALKLPQSGSILRAQYQQVRKLAGWGLTQNDRASFVGWSPQPSAVGPVPHQPGFFIDLGL
jgi:hypothetical protein